MVDLLRKCFESIIRQKTAKYKKLDYGKIQNRQPLGNTERKVRSTILSRLLHIYRMKTLSFHEYTSFSEEQQYDLLFSKREFIDVKEINDKKYVLYKLFDFLVEIVYDTETNKIVNKTVYKTANEN